MKYVSLSGDKIAISVRDSSAEKRRSMSKRKGMRFYILLHDQIAVRPERGLVARQKPEDTMVLQGSLWQLATSRDLINSNLSPTDPRGDPGGGGALTLVSHEFDRVHPVLLSCTTNEVHELSAEEYDLLVALKTCSDRLRVFKDKTWLKEGKEIDINTVVFVLKLADLPEEVPGKVRYKGPLSGQAGTWFGVELSKENHGKGTSNGSFRRCQYFTSTMDSAVFVGINKLRRCDDKNRFLDYRAGCPEEVTRLDIAPPPLQLGERVVWMSDTGAELGTVKWIGFLHDTRDREWTVGVEFDNAVGTGTGKYKDRQLFRAKQNHASLVPILGLIKESEFFSTNMPQPPSRAPVEELKVSLPDRPARPSRELRSRGSNSVSNTNPIVQGSPTRKPSTRKGSKEDEAVARQPQHDSGNRDNNKDLAHNSTTFSDISANGIQPAMDVADAETPPAPVRPPRSSHSRSHSGSSHSDSSTNKPSTSVARSSTEAKQGSSDSPSPTDGTQKQSPDETDGPLPLDPFDLVTDFEIGSMVEVVGNPPAVQYGVIRWLGYFRDRNKPMAGLEMEEENAACTDGTFAGKRLFDCPPRKAFFVYLHKCRKDPRFNESLAYTDRRDSQVFGSIDCPDIPGIVAPPVNISDVGPYLGMQKGIQGHHNSCYLDATLFSMFAFSLVFDTILHRPKTEEDLEDYEAVQVVLREGIVNPLRRHCFVRADKVLKLRTMLDRLSSVKGLMSEEKDPEEFLNCLLQQIMRADPFLKLSNKQESYFYQLFMEKDEKLILPTTQQLLELSFIQSDIKLSEVPSCLILQMPRFGKSFKMYKRIVPSLYLDITDILEHGPRECTICGDLATYECKECYEHFGQGLDRIAYCRACLDKSHAHARRMNHKPRELHVHDAYLDYVRNNSTPGEGIHIERERMELFAVLCIETSHYVAFVKCGSDLSAPWIFFDSMADRMGEMNGYNVPEIRDCPDVMNWLSEENQQEILSISDDKLLPELMRRMLCDSYMCFYQSTDMMMYK